MSLNTLASVAPSGWPTSDSGGPFANWSGGVLATNLGVDGSYVVHGSGHLTVGTPLFTGVAVFDLSSRQWSMRNVPNQPVLEPALVSSNPTVLSGFNEYFESTTPATQGHTYAAHTYGGLIYQSPAFGGGAQGSLIRNFYGGASLSGSRSVHKFDLSSSNAPPQRVIDRLPSGSNYPMAALDTARGGYWVQGYTGSGPLMFVRFSDWAHTAYSSVSFNAYGDQFLVYVPERDCLVAFGRDGSGGVNMSVRVCPIVGGVPQGWTLVSPSGTPPADRRCGGVWSSRLNAIVCYQAAGSYQVHKLVLPSGSLTGSGWSWTNQTLSGNGGATPSKNQVANNGAWGRFVEVPSLGVFVWCDGIHAPVQFWNVT